MKTISSTAKLGPKHHVKEGDVWVNPETGREMLFESGSWKDPEPKSKYADDKEEEADLGKFDSDQPEGD